MSPLAKQRQRDRAEANYLNEFHRQHTEKLKADLANQPKATLEEALAQYERIKRGSKHGKKT